MGKDGPVVQRLRAARRRIAGLAERSRERRKRIVVNIAHSHEEAERWDLEFWQKQTPEMRLAAMESIRRDMEKIRGGKA